MATERTVLVRLKANVSDFKRGMAEAADSVDKTNDRTAWLAQSVLAIGPTLAPLGAAAVPVFSGMAAQMTFAGAAAGTLALGFNGVGDALKALNEYQLEPTAAHLQKMQETMDKVGPSGEEFVRFLDSLGPSLSHLSDTARDGMFPGMTEGLKSLVTLLPKVDEIVGHISTTLGELSSEAGSALAGPKFEKFFEYLNTQARPILTEMGHTIGNFVDGLAAMLVAFAPLSSDFSRGFESMSKGFAEWAHGLDTSSSFADFVEYVRQSVPKALDLIESISNAFVALLKAAAPVGDVMLPVLSDLLKVFTAIADTPIGTVLVSAAAAMSLYGRASALASVTTGGMLKGFAKSEKGLIAQTKAAKAGIPTLKAWGTQVAYMGQSSKYASKETQAARESVRSFGRNAAPAATAIGLLAVTTSGYADKVGLSNTTSLAMAGTMVGPWGSAVGAGIGLLLDAKGAATGFADSLTRVDQVIKTGDIAAINRTIDEFSKKIKDVNTTTSAGDFVSDLGTQVAARFAGKDPLTAYRNKLAELRMAQAELDDIVNKRGGIGSLLSNGLPGVQKAAGDLDDAAGATKRFAAQWLVLQGTLDESNALIAARDSLRELAKVVKDNPKGLRFNTGTAQADAVKSQLNAVVLATANAAAGLKGLNQINYLRNARKSIEDLAKALHLPKKAIDELLDKYKIIDNTPVKPKVEDKPAKSKIKGIAKAWDDLLNNRPPLKVRADTGQAMDAVTALQRLMSQLHDRHINIKVTKSTNAAVAEGTVSADGGTVPKTGLPYADRHLYLLADGEEVISNRFGQADRHRDLLRAINGNMLAGGGTAGGDRNGGPRAHWSPLQRELERMTKALAGSTSAIEKEKSQRDDLISKRADLAQSVGDRFRTDIFGDSPSNFQYFSAADKAKYLTGTPTSILQSDITSAGQFQGLLAQLAGKGLNGGAFAALAGTGDVGRAQAFAGLSRGDLARFEQLFNQREKAAGSVGNYAGAVTYNPQINETNRQLATLNAQNKTLTKEVASLKHQVKASAAHHAKTVAATRRGHNTSRAQQVSP